MRILKSFSLVLFTGLLFTACSKNDNSDRPEPVNEEEVITTMNVTLTPDGDGDVVTLKKYDSDGDGPLAPEVTVLGNLTVGASYKGTIVLLNETIKPAGKVTEEVMKENTDHQFFYNADANLNVTTVYGNTDDNGNPLGTEFTLTAGEASLGTLTITLRHLPKKPNDGTLADAGGVTDVDGTFALEVE